MSALMKTPYTMMIRTRPDEPNCPICQDTRYSYAFVIRGLPLVTCPKCGLLSLNPHPDRIDIPSFYGVDHGEQDPRLVWMDPVTERDAAQHYLRALETRGLTTGRILLVAPVEHPFRREAERRGFTVDLHIAVQDLINQSGVSDLGGPYDAALVLYQLERAAAPHDILRRIRTSLRPDGVLLVALPSIDSQPARWLGKHWTEWRPENIYYFDRVTIQSLLERCGFSQVWTQPERRLHSFRHIRDRAANAPRSLLTRSIVTSYRLLPPPLRNRRARLESSGMIVTATVNEVRPRPLCSIIVPAYNERDTFPVLMDALLTKQLPEMDKEVIVVESNSNDGTREIALHYESHPEVTLILEDRPQGKGHAVRQGIAQARGEIVMIQDADLEYDLNDYEELLEPLLTHAVPFVLGQRHGGRWKMRQFNDQSVLAKSLNIGHVVLTTFLNVLYRQRMQDPFTMFKVFRRECLYGLDFECNRFDFDVELLTKLLRKGYDPLEIPVNYRSRSFREGKKVSLLRDPWTWVRAALKYRLMPLQGPSRRQ